MTTELILGPPGTGKTTSLLDIVDQELTAGTPPQRIGYLAFTRRAAEEAMTRAVEKFNLSRDEFPFFRTIHSLCYRWCGLRPGDVLQGRALRKFAEWAGVTLSGRWQDDGSMVGYTEGDRALHMDHIARVTRRTLRSVYDEADDDLPWSEVERVSRFLSIYKTQQGLHDYTDMLSTFVDQRGSVKLDVLLVDEVQDLSALQWAVINSIAVKVRRVVYAGDDDQGIYRWAGADVRTMVDLPVAARVLGRSYRVPRAVQALAAEVIAGVTHRRPKEWAPREEEGTVDRVEDVSQIDVESGDTLILARNAYVLQDQVVPELRRRGLYFKWGDREAVAPAVLAAIRIWETLRAGGSVTVDAAAEVYGWMSPGCGYRVGQGKLPTFKNREEEVTLADLRDRGGLLTTDIWHKALDKLPRDEVDFLLAARRRGERVNGAARVRLSTIHGSKGGQADHVVLLTEQAKRTFLEGEKFPDDERRVQYVGITRARERLTIVGTAAQYYYPL